MTYQIGDKVVHWTFGIADIIGFEEKRLAGESRQYYVVLAGPLTLWVPMDETGEQSLRPPTPSREFKSLINILSSPGEQMPENRYQRQNELAQRMQKKKMDDICSIIRDLTTRGQSQKLNRNDSEVLKRAEEFLLDEWVLSLGTARDAARRELEGLLRGRQETKKPELRAHNH